MNHPIMLTVYVVWIPTLTLFTLQEFPRWFRKTVRNLLNLSGLKTGVCDMAETKEHFELTVISSTIRY